LGDRRLILLYSLTDKGFTNGGIENLQFVTEGVGLKGRSFGSVLNLWTRPIAMNELSTF
jgi:hypothetical protein